MTFQQFLLILRARRLAVFFTLLVVVGGTIVGSLFWPKRYTATATVVVDFKGVDPILGIMMPSTMMPTYLSTQVDIIKSHKVALGAVKLLRVADSPVARQQFLDEVNGRGKIEDWLADLLLKNLEVEPGKESSLIEVSFKASDPEFAALVANAFVDAYQATNLELRVDPAKQTAVWFDEQLKVLKANVEIAQANLSKYQREKGIHSSDEKLDVENAKLGELSAAYTQAQASAFDLLSRQRQLKEFLGRGADPATLPDVLANPLLQQMKSTLSQSEARFDQISSQLGANHPEVQKLKADIATQRQKLRTEIETVSAGITNASSIAEKREQELRVAVAEHKAKLLRANQGRDELSVLMKEAETSQHAYDAAAQRFTQTNLESQATLTNIAVLNRAIPPLGQSSPKLLLNSIVAIMFGSIVAVGLALSLEIFDRRVRSEFDMVSGVDFPLLGILERTGKAKKPQALTLSRRRLAAPAAG